MDNCGECACFNCLRGRFVQYGPYFRDVNLREFP